jgi:DNA (cytosine-5)-methyltransferase 1
MSPEGRDGWTWWNPGPPPVRNTRLEDFLEPDADVPWYSKKEAGRLLGKMAKIHVDRVEKARLADVVSAGGLYVRTRVENGRKIVRSEVRFDGMAGCLRTANGGSSRQRLVVAGNGKVGVRLLSPREGARLMGLPDDYMLPKAYNEAFNLLGDGVCVPAVTFVRDRLVEPLLSAMK